MALWLRRTESSYLPSQVLWNPPDHLKSTARHLFKESRVGSACEPGPRGQRAALDGDLRITVVYGYQAGKNYQWFDTLDACRWYSDQDPYVLNWSQG